MRRTAPTRDELAWLHRTLEAYAGGPLPGWDRIDGLVTVIDADAKDVIISEADGMSHVFYCVHGYVRQSVITSEGDERLTSLVEPGMMLVSPQMRASTGGALAANASDGYRRIFEESTRRHTPYRAVALTPTTLLRVPYDAMTEMTVSHREWSLATLSQAFAFAAYQEMRIRDFLSLSANDRYDRFLATAPHLADLLSKRDTAAYLGIAPESFSRLLKRRLVPRTP